MQDSPSQDEHPTFDSTPVAKKVKPVPKLQFLHAYSFVFESPNWPLNLLLATVCMFIPAVGPIVVAGYEWDVVETMHRFPKSRYPDFDFNRFVEYIIRGVWSYLVGMVTGLMQMVIYVVSVYGGMALIFMAGSSAPPDQEELYLATTATVVVPLALFCVFGIPVLIRSLVMPLVMKASLSQDPKGLVDFGFLNRFLRLTWREMVLEQLWMAVTGPIVFVFGLLFFFVGVYPAWTLVKLADAHTNWQLYEIYLARGGEPIALKPLKPAPAPWVDMAPRHDQQGQVPPLRELPLIEPHTDDDET